MYRLYKLLILCTLLLAQPLFAQAQINREVINTFNSDIKIYTDSTVSVTETITVTSLGKAIRRGIVREIPTVYKDRLGKKYKVSFKINRVLLNGYPSPFHTKHVNNGIKIYVGNKNVKLKPGQYTYTIAYQTKRVIGYFKQYDELYWNVTGNYWRFPILQSSATVTLPINADITQYHGYTGRIGATGQQYTAEKLSPNIIRFTSTGRFNPGSGMTIAVAWPKGIIYQPTASENFWLTLKDNQGIVIGFLMILLLFIYYTLAWWHVGRDPVEGTVIPLFNPPEGFSPAAMRYIKKMRYDNKAFTAAIVSMAVKGFLTITDNHDDYILIKTNEEHESLSPGELAIAAKLFSSGDVVKMENKNHSEISGAISGLRKKLKTEFSKIYFLTNSVYLIPGILLSIVALIIVVTAADDVGLVAFFVVWLSGWSAACFMLIKNAVVAWLAVFKHNFSIKNTGAAIGSTVFSIPFLVGEAVGLYMLTKGLGIYGTVLFVSIVTINIVFYELLKAHTFKGRKLVDRIDGFKQFLSKAEQPRLDAANPPEKTPQLFERYLPFAIALNVETRWAEQFNSVLNNASADKQYRPAWYNGRSFSNFNVASMASGLGSGLTSSVASSATAPGSSSGSGGGGSSGGGGGGGGGGGW